MSDAPDHLRAGWFGSPPYFQPRDFPGSHYFLRSVWVALLQLLLGVAVVFLVGVAGTWAQTLSIVNLDSSREAILLEASLKRFLHDSGYIAHGTGMGGYVVLLHGMSAKTNQGVPLGVVGSAAVTKVLRKEAAATLAPETQFTSQEFVEKFTTVMGSPVIYLASTTAIGGNAETVAEILSIYITTVVRRLSATPQVPLWTLEDESLKHLGTNYTR